MKSDSLLGRNIYMHSGAYHMTGGYGFIKPVALVVFIPNDGFNLFFYVDDIKPKGICYAKGWDDGDAT